MSMSALRVQMDVIKSVSTLMDLMCVHAGVAIDLIRMELVAPVSLIIIQK